MPESVDLELATLDQIMDELGRRFTHVIVARAMDAKGEDGKEAFCVAWRGGFTGAVGLAVQSLTYFERDGRVISQ